jgi:transketolase
LDNALQQVLVEGWDQHLPHYTASNATRNAGGDALNAIATHFPTMIGGDADLAGSTKTLIKGANHTAHHQPAARNIRFGVREHAMGAIVNGLALHGGSSSPDSATFLTFSDYMRPAMRLGASMHLPAVYVFTHDSIGLGEDGPTHQSVEHVMALRLIPNSVRFSPGGQQRNGGSMAHPNDFDQAQCHHFDAPKRGVAVSRWRSGSGGTGGLCPRR